MFADDMEVVARETKEEWQDVFGTWPEDKPAWRM